MMDVRARSRERSASRPPVIWLNISTAVCTIMSFMVHGMHRTGSRMPSASGESRRTSMPPMDLTNGPKSDEFGFGSKNTMGMVLFLSSGFGRRPHCAARCRRTRVLCVGM